MGKDTIVIRFDYTSNLAYAELPFQFKNYFTRTYGECHLLFTFPKLSETPSPNHSCVFVFHFVDSQTANRVKQKYHCRVLFQCRIKNCWLENAQMFDLNITESDVFARKQRPITGPDSSSPPRDNNNRTIKRSPSPQRHSRRNTPSPDHRRDRRERRRGDSDHRGGSSRDDNDHRRRSNRDERRGGSDRYSRDSSSERRRRRQSREDEREESRHRKRDERVTTRDSDPALSRKETTVKSRSPKPSTSKPPLSNPPSPKIQTPSLASVKVEPSSEEATPSQTMPMQTSPALELYCDKTPRQASPVLELCRDKTPSNTSPVSELHSDKTKAGPALEVCRDETPPTKASLESELYRDKTQVGPVSELYHDKTPTRTSPPSEFYRDETPPAELIQAGYTGWLEHLQSQLGAAQSLLPWSSQPPLLSAPQLSQAPLLSQPSLLPQSSQTSLLSQSSRPSQLSLLSPSLQTLFPSQPAIVSPPPTQLQPLLPLSSQPFPPHSSTWSQERELSTYYLPADRQTHSTSTNRLHTQQESMDEVDKLHVRFQLKNWLESPSTCTTAVQTDEAPGEIDQTTYANTGVSTETSCDEGLELFGSNMSAELKLRTVRPTRKVPPKYYELRKTVLQDYKEQVNTLAIVHSAMIKNNPSLKPMILSTLKKLVHKARLQTEASFWEIVDRNE